MEIFTLDKDIPVICFPAVSFPNGVKAAHEKLHSTVPFDPGRGYYGLSWSDGRGGIVYKAAAGQLHDGEAAQYGGDPFVIRKGQYLSAMLFNFPDDMGGFGRIFEEMLADVRIDPNGYCVEVYLNERDVRCMVLLDT